MNLRRTAGHTVAALCVGIALTACSDNPADEAVTLDDAEETSEAGGILDKEDEPEVDLDGAGRLLTADEAEAALPTMQQMPKGWSRDPDNEDDDDDEMGDDVEPERCQAVFDALETDDEDPAVSAERAFEQDDFGPFVTVEVQSYDEELPDGRFGDVVDVLEDCPEWTSTDDEGTKTEFQASGLDFPNLGEESLALALEATSEGWPFTMDMVIIRAGHNLVTAMHMAIGGKSDAELLEQVARTTMENLSG